MCPKGRLGVQVRLAAVAATMIVVLSACSPAATMVLVRKADGYYVADGACPTRTVSTVKVTPLDASTGQPSGATWVANTFAMPPSRFPASGIRLGGNGLPWGTAKPVDFDVEPGPPLLIATSWGEGDSGQAETYETRIEVGQYIEYSGAVGQWSDLVARSECLAE